MKCSRSLTLIAALCLLSPGLVGAQDPGPAADSTEEPKVDRERLKGLSGAQLQAEFEEHAQKMGFAFDSWNYDACLLEMVRRGGDEWIQYLERYLVEVEKARVARNTSDRGELRNLEPRTALRRLQGKPDPMMVVVMNPKRPNPRSRSVKKLGSNYPELPFLEVALKNQDKARESLGYQQLGDYRSGRQTRWRIELHDSNGKPVEPITTTERSMDGGMTSRATLDPKGTWETRLVLSRYIQPLAPGKYTLRVLYHDHLDIANQPSNEGLVLSASQEVAFEWKARRLKVSSGQRKKTDRLVDELIEGRTVQLTERTYREGTKLADKPETPFEKLYDMGHQALPSLIDRLRDSSLSGEDRAWLFAMLYSLTGLNDPRVHKGVLSGYEFVMAPTGSPTTGGIIGGRGSSSGGVITEEAQDALAQRWFAILVHLGG